MAERLGLRLDPLDVLFFRDGRPFGEATRVEGGLPHPQVLAGALRTAMLARSGFDFREFAARRQNGAKNALAILDDMKNAPRSVTRCRFRGPWLALETDGRIEPLLATPQVLVRDGERWARSRPWDPKRIPGWPDESTLRPLWRTTLPDGKTAGGFLTPAGVAVFLKGGCPTNDDRISDDELFDYDDRTGIVVNPDSLTTVKGQLYGIRFLALKPRFERKGHALDQARIVIYAEALPPEGAMSEVKQLLGDGPTPFGGEGRYVRCKALDEPFDWPSESGSRTVWLLASPAIYGPGRTLPAGPVVAAASAAAFAVSGWDVARNGPRPTRFAVPAGAVYFFDDAFAPDRDSLCSDDELIQEGWGYALQGVWNDG